MKTIIVAPALASIHKHRQNIALKAIKTPRSFKVCHGCERLVLEKTESCPNCHAYRFDAREGAVAAAARRLQNVPENHTELPHLPRFLPQFI